MNNYLESRIPLKNDSLSEIDTINTFLRNRTYQEKDIPCNILASYSVKADAKSYGKAIGGFLYTAGNPRHDRVVVCSFKELTEQTYTLKDWLKNCHACVFICECEPDMEKLHELCVQLSSFPNICFCLCTHIENKQTILSDPKIRESFQHQIEISYPDAEFICTSVIAKFHSNHYRVTDSFSNALKDFCQNDYSIAHQNSEQDIKNIYGKIIKEHLKKNSYNRLIEASSVPKPEKIRSQKVCLKSFPAAAVLQKFNANNSSEEHAVNILICSISLLPYKAIPHYYYTSFNNTASGSKTTFIFKGISQLEPGTKFFINKLACEGKRIDRIIPYCSVESYEDKRSIEATGQDNITSVEFYIKQIIQYMVNKENFIQQDNDGKNFVELPLSGQKGEKELYTSKIQNGIVDDGRKLYFNDQNEWTLEYPINQDDIDNSKCWIRPVREPKSNNVDSNVQNLKILNEFYKLINTEISKGPVHIYLDAQGGMRSFFNVIYSLFSMFDSSKIRIESVCATDYKPTNLLNKIRDVSPEYQTMHLVSAINAFSHYGRGELLDEYFTHNMSGSASPEEQKLIQAIKLVSESISVSDPNGFNNGLDLIKTALSDIGTTQNSVLSLLAEDIQEKYGSLIQPDDRTPLETIRWCTANKFTQQALAFIEDKMPTFILTKIMPTQIRGKEPDSYRPIADITASREDEKLLNRLSNNQHKRYVDPANTILYEAFNKCVVAEANLAYKHSVILELLASHISTTSIRFESSDSKDNLKSILSNPSIKPDKYDPVPELIQLYLNDNTIDLCDFINRTSSNIKLKNNFNNVRNYVRRNRAIRYINSGSKPNDTQQCPIVSLIDPNRQYNDLRDFYKMFYRYVFKISATGQRNQMYKDFKKAFCEASFLIDWIGSDSSAISILKEYFTNLVVDLMKDPHQNPTEDFINLSKSYCAYFGINLSMTIYGSNRELAHDIFENLLMNNRDLYTTLTESIRRHTYNQTTAQEEFNSLTSRENDIDTISFCSEFIEKYCAFREHEALREWNDGSFEPDYWDDYVIRDCRGHLNAQHSLDQYTPVSFDYYTTILGYQCNNTGSTCEAIMPIKEHGSIKVSYHRDFRDKLDLYLRLQRALKKERNNSSHASDNALRLPLSTIERVIHQYILLSDELAGTPV